ncbi:uracil-DNA glycosylase [Pollutimonas bauzanensis]|nr:uracil-DNA glycosylase [Pollutimonas bauzanensis]
MQSKAPELSALQMAWLQEIGMDKRMLARYAADAGPFPEAAGRPAARQRDTPPIRGDKPTPAAGAQPAAPGLVRAAAVLAGQQGTAGAPGPAGAAVKKPAADVSAPPAAAPRDWEALQAHIASCEVCGLHAGRSQAVFGTGAVQSPEWMVVGEAPGEHDDRVGLPFQGKPGLLLQAMLASIGVLPESAVFFTNLIKCRPLGNRTPKPEEIAACLPYLQRQIALLKPRRILVLGKLAAQALLGSDADLEQLRGRVHHIRSETGEDIALVATYHPASLLLRPQHKADAWQDLNLARSIAPA